MALEQAKDSTSLALSNRRSGGSILKNIRKVGLPLAFAALAAAGCGARSELGIDEGQDATTGAGGEGGSGGQGGSGGGENCNIVKVKVSEDTPTSQSVPKGATHVPFTCWTFNNGCEANALNTIVHRFAAGDGSDLYDFRLYKDGTPVSEIAALDLETQEVAFKNLPIAFAPFAEEEICVEASVSMSAQTQGQHGIEIDSKEKLVFADPSTQAEGEFPLQGNPMTIAGVQTGTVTISKNGTFEEISANQEDARVAQFELELGATEGGQFSEVLLRMDTSCVPTDLKLMDGPVLIAHTDGLDANNIAAFILDNPYLIPQDAGKIFHVTADIGCCNGEWKTYLESANDLFVTGTTFGTGLAVENLYDGTNISGIPLFSEVNVTGSCQ